MKVLKVSWNEYDDVTTIKFSDEFKSSNWLVKLDVLKDLINDLTSHYDLIVSLNCKNRNKYNFDEIED
jgi:hypothetical protein